MTGGALKWLWLSALVLVLDQITKWIAVSALTLHQPVQVLPLVNLTLTYNPGAAFSFLSSAGGWQRWFFSALAVPSTSTSVFMRPVSMAASGPSIPGRTVHFAVRWSTPPGPARRPVPPTRRIRWWQ